MATKLEKNTINVFLQFPHPDPFRTWPSAVIRTPVTCLIHPWFLEHRVGHNAGSDILTIHRPPAPIEIVVVESYEKNKHQKIESKNGQPFHPFETGLNFYRFE